METGLSSSKIGSDHPSGSPSLILACRSSLPYWKHLTPEDNVHKCFMNENFRCILFLVCASVCVLKVTRSSDSEESGRCDPQLKHVHLHLAPYTDESAFPLCTSG